LDEFCSLQSVSVRVIPDVRQNAVEDSLKKLHLSRNVVLVTSSYLAAIDVIRGSNLVAEMPAMVFRKFKHMLDMVDLPLDIEEYPLYVAWHPRADDDLGNRWLRKLVKRVAREEKNDPKASWFSPDPPGLTK
jgi:DNA-binding transcriptional LysR family regulator